MIVVDASVLAPALVDDGTAGDVARHRLQLERVAAPHLIDLEIGSVLRGQVLAGKLPLRRAALALQDLAELALERVEHRRLLPRCWELRDNLTVYDRAYVALAELLDAPLVTADARLARADGIACRVELLEA